MASLSIRIDLEGGGRIGPGKMRLLKAVAEAGSISAAGRALGMSYRRAWSLVAELNALFDAPLVETAAGGAQGGGATLTDLGRRVLAACEAVQAAASAGAVAALAELDAQRGLRKR